MKKILWSDEGFEKIVKAAERGRETQKKNIEKLIIEYERNPSRCTYCNNPLSYKKRKGKFCNKSCAALYNNSKRELQEITCLNCDSKILKKTGIKFCSKQCEKEYKNSLSEKKFDNGEMICNSSIKKILIRRYGNKCQICHNETWNDKHIPLEVEHMDGNSGNNSPDNVILICPNCHAQTSTYKSKNKGNGRYSRRIRYIEGKSY